VDAAAEGVTVPRQYVKDGKIVLNVSLSATQMLKLGNDFVSFDARFGGVSFSVLVPIRAILGIYARETGQGMIFPEGDADPDPTDGPPAAPPPAAVRPPRKSGPSCRSSSSAEGVPDPGHLARAAGTLLHGEDVEAQDALPPRGAALPLVERGADEPAALAPRHRRQGAAVVRAGPQPHLDDHQHLAVEARQIDLAALQRRLRPMTMSPCAAR